MLIFSGIYENARKTPLKVCMISGNKSITYVEILKNINQMALILTQKYKKGSRVIIKNSNSINTIIYSLACSKAGLIFSIVDTRMLPSTIEQIKKKINPCCIIDENYNFLIDEDLQNIKKFPCVKDTDIFMGILSSGTTGHNKVIWRDHRGWTKAYKYHGEVFNISSKDRLFFAGSLVYSANLYSALHILNEGGSIVFSKSIYPRIWLKEIEKNNVSSIFMVPAHYRMLLKEMKLSISNINSILSCGDKLDGKTLKALKDSFPNSHIYEYYGACELGIVSFTDFGKNFNIDSVGKAYPKVKLWIEDDLIWVQSPYIAPYFAPKATVYDLGRIDDEGNLYILGRKNHTINKGGVKILPSSIEKILDSHPKILKSFVFGVENTVKGEEIAAIIIAESNELTIKDVREYCRDNIELCYRPKKIKITTNPDINLNGKLNVKNLCKLAFNGKI